LKIPAIASQLLKNAIKTENKINTENLKSHEMAMNIYGEGKLKVNATDQLRITAFGEPEIHVNGGAHIRRYIFGEAKISRD